MTSMFSLGSGWNEAKNSKIIEIFHFESLVWWLLVILLRLWQRVHWYVVTSGKVVSNLISASITLKENHFLNLIKNEPKLGKVVLSATKVVTIGIDQNVMIKSIH